MVFRGRSPRNSIIPHKGYNPHTLENHSTADLYYDATTQTLGSVSLPQSLYFTMQLGYIFIQQIQAPLQQTGCLKNHLVLLCKLFLHSCLWLIKLTTTVVLVLALFLLQRCMNLLYTLGCMKFLEYMGFVLAVFPLKYGFIIVQVCMFVCM